MQLHFTKSISDSAHSGLPSGKWLLLHGTSAVDCSNLLPNSASKQELPSVLLSSPSQLLSFLTPVKSVCPQYVLSWSLWPQSARALIGSDGTTTLTCRYTTNHSTLLPNVPRMRFPLGARPASSSTYLPFQLSNHVFHEHHIQFL